MGLGRFSTVLQARNREFLRDRMALSWNIVLPVLIVIGFAFAFTSDSKDIFKVGVHGQEDRNGGFLDTAHIQFIPVSDIPAAVTKVERHQLDMLMDLAEERYWINGGSAKGYVLEKLLAAAFHLLSFDGVLQRQQTSFRSHPAQ